MCSRRHFFLTACIFVLLSGTGNAALWYVRPVSGEVRSGSGTSYQDAFCGWSGIEWKKINPGDTVFYCGLFHATDEKNRIYIGASGTAAGGYVYLKSCKVANGASVDDPWWVDWRSSIPDWKDPKRWVRVGSSSRWQMSLNTPHVPRRMFFIENGQPSTVEGQRKCSAATVVAEFDWYVDRSKKILLVFAEENPAIYFSSMKSNNYLLQASAIDVAGDWVDISGLSALGQGGDYFLRLVGRNNVRIHELKVYDTGNIAIVSNSEIPLHKAATYIEIYDNLFDSRFTKSNADADCMDAAVGAGIYFWGSVQHSKIFRNTIKNYMKPIGLLGCAENCEPLSGGVENNDVYENDVSCPDLKYGYAYISGGTTKINKNGFLRNNRIFRNYFHDFTNGVAVAGEDTLFANNTIYNVSESMRRGKSKTGVGITTGGIGGENNLRFVGNTISRTKEACIKVWDNNVNGYEFSDNTLSDCGYSSFENPNSIVVEDNGNDLRPNHFVWKRNIIRDSKRGSSSSEIKYRGTGLSVGEWNRAASHGDIIENNTQQ